jgi:hypothetical protein
VLRDLTNGIYSYSTQTNHSVPVFLAVFTPKRRPGTSWMALRRWLQQQALSRALTQLPPHSGIISVSFALSIAAAAMHCLNLKGLFVPSFLMHMGDCHRYYGRLTTSLMPAQNERPQSPILWLLFSHLSNNSISTGPDPRFTVSIRPFWSRTPMRSLTV